ncbi:Hypothetical_protein [Hexamita inflata]|uniref:Hypothetical_protein n=1 Tax=Hexamita inflata TaxID=28002 RepID=A0AA86NMC9_9EUKA|nr:Hypothetical protein HINF_LOCUS9778 [Hexamita inflata]CAI9978056.1 Hypothetical protein HINF_LOCUS65701 [Hexamita inflata]
MFSSTRDQQDSRYAISYKFVFSSAFSAFSRINILSALLKVRKSDDMLFWVSITHGSSWQSIRQWKSAGKEYALCFVLLGSLSLGELVSFIWLRMDGIFIICLRSGKSVQVNNIEQNL